jgi:hypothetical protein
MRNASRSDHKRIAFQSQSSREDVGRLSFDAQAIGRRCQAGK